MLSFVEVENFRLFEHYRLAGLSRVNLLVGENNCGKSSLLEAAHFLASGGDLRVLLAYAGNRGETAVLSDEETIDPVVSHWFSGHRIDPGNEVVVRGDGGCDEIRVLIENAYEADFRSSYPTENPNQIAEMLDGIQSDVAISLSGGVNGPDGIVLPIAGNGTISRSASFHYRRAIRRENGTVLPILSIPSSSLGPDEISGMWDSAVMAGVESAVVAALGILEPRLTNLFFLPGSAKYRRRGGPPDVLLELEGENQRIPLGSSGDGMRRLLTIALALVQSRGGLLLVDEIDAGFHYSIMAKMWHLVIESASRAKTQVFATTHSSDCVRGLARFCREHPALREEVSLQKISRELEESVALDAERIMLAAEQGMEVR